MATRNLLGALVFDRKVFVELMLFGCLVFVHDFLLGSELPVRSG